MAGFITGVHLQPSNLSALGSGFPRPEESHTTSLGERGFSFPFPRLRLTRSLLFWLLFHALFLSAAMAVPLLGGRSGASGEGLGHCTPDTRYTGYSQAQPRYFALCLGTGCLVPPKQQQYCRDTCEMNSQV